MLALQIALCCVFSATKELAFVSGSLVGCLSAAGYPLTGSLKFPEYTNVFPFSSNISQFFNCVRKVILICCSGQEENIFSWMHIHITQSVANLPRGVKSISDQPSAMVLSCVHSVTSRLSSPQKKLSTLCYYLSLPRIITCTMLHVYRNAYYLSRETIFISSHSRIHYSRVVDCSLSQWRRQIPQIVWGGWLRVVRVSTLQLGGLGACPTPLR